MMSAALAGDLALFVLGVLAGLSWPKLRAWISGEVDKTKAAIKADIERKL